VLIGLAYLWHRAQLERRVALERVRSRIAADLHDDIGATLSRVAVISEVVKNSVGVADADARRRLTELAETSRALVGNMSDIVWSIDARHDNIGDVMARFRAFGSDVLESRGIRWTCEASFRVRLSPEQRRDFYLIFKEAINNAGRHSQARNVALRVDLRNGRLCGEIWDDGSGFSDNGVCGIGIRSMRERAERLGGTFSIGPRSESGTIVRVELPLRSSKQHDHALARQKDT
jgi:signal transduction histidine kinase